MYQSFMAFWGQRVSACNAIEPTRQSHNGPQALHALHESRPGFHTWWAAQTIAWWILGWATFGDQKAIDPSIHSMDLARCLFQSGSPQQSASFETLFCFSQRCGVCICWVWPRLEHFQHPMLKASCPFLVTLSMHHFKGNNVPSSYLLLVVMPGATSSFLLLVAMPFVY